MRADHVIDVSAGLVFRKGRLLITQRRPGDHLAGLWEFPGGKREFRESFETCLRREMLEELGIEVQVRELLASVDHAYPGKRVHLQFYRCSAPDGEPQAIGCHALAWIERPELDHYAFPPADEQILELIRKRSELWQND
jgi:mutator protein MutT